MLMEQRLMMEEKKQLDFNRPLLSVRRPESKTRTHESAVTNKIHPPPSPSPPFYKSDIKSGPVRNPGTVPFQWEHKPGKPKDETKPDLQCFVEPHFVPKLPPGRKQDHFGSKLDVNTNHVDDDDETYVEANDTFSRSESFFFNCSNVSGLDGSGLLVEPFGSLSSDRQTQDLMMGRFLPAAKALTSYETFPPKPEEDESPRRLMKQNKTEPKNPYRFRHSPDQRAVSVRRMRSKYQDPTTLKQTNEIVAQGASLLVSTNQESDEKLETPRAKISKKFGELLASDDNTTWPEAPVAEKTLYVDIVHSVDKKVQEESMKQHSLDVLDPPPVKDVPKLNGADEEAKREEKNIEECQDHHQDIVALQETKKMITTNLESSRLHIPPLPKAPSDSWLKRTLPTIPSKKNTFTWLESDDNDNHFNKIQTNPKWETLVKTPFSKEVLNPIPEA